MMLLVPLVPLENILMMPTKPVVKTVLPVLAIQQLVQQNVPAVATQLTVNMYLARVQSPLIQRPALARKQVVVSIRQQPVLRVHQVNWVQQVP